MMATVKNGEADDRLRAVSPKDYDRMSMDQLFAPISAAVIPANKLWTGGGRHVTPQKAAHSGRRAVVNTRGKPKGAGL